MEIDPLLPSGSRVLLAVLPRPGRVRLEPKSRFEELVKIMVDTDMETVGLQPPGEGRKY